MDIQSLNGTKVDIQWLDGTKADNHFILEMSFTNGSKSYLKSQSYKKICFWYEHLWSCPDLVAMTIYNKCGSVVCQKTKASMAA